MSEKVKLCSVADLLEGEMVSYTVNNFPIAATKIGNNVFAVEDMCSHAKCSLSEGLIENESIVCPCHGAAFDLNTGEPLNPPAKKPIKTYGVLVDGESLYIKL
ncbi:Rieske (2Fe-2S) protein [Neobacillus sp. NPDC093127]|uniref:Rieske (2Fe-2S) protein n=1 Tax=Neobacillus sp. NPDC093127 TaxID=3364296 RepID=UPI0037F9ED15